MTDRIVQAQHEAAEAEWLAAWLAGPKRTRWTSLPPQVGDSAPDLELPDTSGDVRRMSAWWTAGTVHLVFLRHFGCSCLAERWDRLRDGLAEIRNAGATTIAIAQGEPERTADLAGRRGFTIPILCDPDRRAYDAFGLLEGTPAQVLHDFPWRAGDHETVATSFAPRRGTERAVVDDPWQLPGEFIVAEGGRIILAHRSQHCEDFPTQTVLLGAIAAARHGGRSPATGGPV